MFENYLQFKLFRFILQLLLNYAFTFVLYKNNHFFIIEAKFKAKQKELLWNIRTYS